MQAQGSYPRITEKRHKLVVEMAPATAEEREVGVEFVLDFNGYGDLVGIEIVSLGYYAGPHVMEALGHNFKDPIKHTSFSYDEEADAFYLRVSDDHSLDQRVVDGKVVLDTQGYLVRLEADLRLQGHFT